MTDAEELAEIRAAARDLLASEGGLNRSRAVGDTRDRLDQRLWEAFASAGWLALGVPEELGGAGAELDAVLVVCEEIGRALAPSALSMTVAVSGPVLAGGGAETVALVEACASGESVVVPAFSGLDSVFSSNLRVSAEPDPAGGFVLTGSVPFVLDAAAATDFLVTALSPDGAVGVFIVPAEAVRREEREPIDLTRRVADVRLDGASVGPERVLHAPGPDGARAAGDLARRLLLAVAAEARGGLGEVLERTIAYATMRQQFNRPIASFQVIKHRLADIYVEEQLATASLAIAADATRTGDDARLALGKARITASYVAAVGLSLQTHGGIGYTWEHDLHLFVKRAQLDAEIFGSSRRLHLGAKNAIVAEAMGAASARLVTV
jgi:alkylation response protein AidB-like acyl-CoA dehydrogenase